MLCNVFQEFHFYFEIGFQNMTWFSKIQEFYNIQSIEYSPCLYHLHSAFSHLVHNPEYIDIRMFFDVLKYVIHSYKSTSATNAIAAEVILEMQTNNHLDYD